jgi:aspartate-semialdehyde dehydrogenase
VVSTYQSITGTGVSGRALENEYAGVQAKWPINTLFIEMQFHNVMFEENGYTKEEMKLVVKLKNIRR